MSAIAIAAVSLLSGVLAYCVLWALAPVVEEDKVAADQLNLTTLGAICVTVIVAIALGCAR